MRLLLDFFPIALFVVAYKMHDVYVATAVLMGATVLQMGIIYAMERQLQTMHRITLALVLVFGALTLGLHDERFIKWKPTVLYSAMALGLAIAQWGFKRNVLHLLLGKQLALPQTVWTRLTMAWVVYFVFMAAINAYVAVAFSTDAWVNFKLWGYVFPIAFLLGQGIYIAPYLKNDSQP